MMKVFRLTIILSGAIFWFGCKEKPAGILPVDKLKVVFLHHLMAEEMVNNFIARDTSINFDSARTAIFSGILKLDNTDSATFNRSVNYYKADPERFSELLDSVNALATREKEFHEKKVAKALRKKAVADSIAQVDSLAKMKKKPATDKDSAGVAKDTIRRPADSLKKGKAAPSVKDTAVRRKK